MTEIYNIETSMGFLCLSSFNNLPFLTEVEIKELNNIGYSGKNFNGDEMSQTEFLNSLNKGTFIVKQTKFDCGDFSEAFTIVRTFNQNPSKVQEPLYSMWTNEVIHCSINGHTIFAIENSNGNYKIFFIGFIPSYIIENGVYVDLLSDEDNDFTSFDDAKIKCQEIIDKFFNHFLK
jgi:hypothetical protein